MPSHAKLSTIRPAKVVYVGVLCSPSGRVNLVGKASRPCIPKHMIARKRTHAEVHDPHLPIEIIEPSVSVYARLGQLGQLDWGGVGRVGSDWDLLCQFALG